MNQTVLQQIRHYAQGSPLARLSPPHGYRFDGDTVHLHAKFSVADEGAYRRQWLLQLWACPARPNSAEDLAGEVVAEVALPSMHEIADETEHLEISAFSRPPAGAAEYFLALVLVAGRLGKFDEVHDVASYPNPQRFLQPRMRGSVGYQIYGDRVRLSAERIENPRDPANRSGTLALELWALETPYTGGDFNGVPLAGVAIGSLAGLTESTTTSYELPYSQPPAGNWYFVLMLREWTAAGYVTRDFANFDNPVTYAPTQVEAPEKTEPLTVAAAIPSELPAKDAEKAKVIPSTRHTTEVEPAVSVNTAAEKELAAVEGITPTIAKAIIKKRPFGSLDDLRRVKGVSLKLLTEIRSRLGL